MKIATHRALITIVVLLPIRSDKNPPNIVVNGMMKLDIIKV